MINRLPFAAGDKLDPETISAFILERYLEAEDLEPRLSAARWFAKRVFDLVMAVFGLVLMLPVFLVTAVLIKLDSPGPVIFRQMRVGKNGKKFQIYKFRTMQAGAEKMGKFFVRDDDPRLTRLGKILRRFKIDELPQLWNVIKGEMSMAGPRPMIPEIVDHYPPRAKRIVLSVPPGITDFASLVYINEGEILRKAGDPEELYLKQMIPSKLYYYVYYVKEQSVWVDLKIIGMTLWRLVRGGGE
ncbi:MAG: sugar transferase [Firmicutes bacterium]|nr:sugar transferase [Bacillota bacterium]